MKNEAYYSRADAKLKRLPLPLMAALIAMLGKPGVTQADALTWLRDQPDGCKSSEASLSQSFTWLVTRVAAYRREQQCSAKMAAIKESNPDISDEALFRIGQRIFAEEAIAESDADAWRTVQGIELKRSEQQLNREKFEEMKRRAAQADATEQVLTEAGMTPEQRAQRIREIYGRA